MSRRGFLAGAAALPVAAQARGFAGKQAGGNLLERAIAVRGGRTWLDQIRALRWDGILTIGTPERNFAIGVDSRVAPFGRARTASWRVDESGKRMEKATRTLIVEPEGGFMDLDGARTPLTPAQTEHERQQYGLYGYMLLTRAPAWVEGDEIVSRREGYPEIRFSTDAGARLTGARYDVAAAEGNGIIRQRMTFSGWDGTDAWPRTIEITQEPGGGHGGRLKLYFHQTWVDY